MPPAPPQPQPPTRTPNPAFTPTPPHPNNKSPQTPTSLSNPTASQPPQTPNPHPRHPHPAGPLPLHTLPNAQPHLPGVCNPTAPLTPQTPNLPTSPRQAFAGIVTVSVGHCHPDVVAAVNAQTGLLQHTTTIYLNNQVGAGLAHFALVMGSFKGLGLHNPLINRSDSQQLKTTTTATTATPARWRSTPRSWRTGCPVTSRCAVGGFGAWILGFRVQGCVGGGGLKGF